MEVQEFSTRFFLKNISKYPKKWSLFAVVFSMWGQEKKICNPERKRAQRKENLLVSSFICLVKIYLQMSECCTVLYKNDLQPSEQLAHSLRDLFAQLTVCPLVGLSLGHFRSSMVLMNSTAAVNCIHQQDSSPDRQLAQKLLIYCTVDSKQGGFAFINTNTSTGTKSSAPGTESSLARLRRFMIVEHIRRMHCTLSRGVLYALIVLISDCADGHGASRR